MGIGHTQIDRKWFVQFKKLFAINRMEANEKDKMKCTERDIEWLNCIWPYLCLSDWMVKTIIFSVLCVDYVRAKKSTTAERTKVWWSEVTREKERNENIAEMKQRRNTDCRNA